MIESSTLTITCPICKEEHVISPLPEALKSTEVNERCVQLFKCPKTKQIYQVSFRREALT